jgi:aconitate hydratase
VNPLVPVDLVIDHSVMVDVSGTPDRAAAERRTSSSTATASATSSSLGPVRLRQFPRRAAGHRHLPPGEPGIPRAGGLDAQDGPDTYAFPDSCYGTDSHTTMVNGLGVLGWGVGGIEAEAAMLGQPIAMLIPDVIGFKLIGKLREGVTAPTWC